jgi:hypothetical protein
MTERAQETTKAFGRLDVAGPTVIREASSPLASRSAERSL